MTIQHHLNSLLGRQLKAKAPMKQLAGYATLPSGRWVPIRRVGTTTGTLFAVEIGTEHYSNSRLGDLKQQLADLGFGFARA